MVKDMAKSVRQRLLNLRDETGRSFNNILVEYAIERLLYRLYKSEHINRFVLKGAILFSIFENIPRRVTRDVDLLAFGDLNHSVLKGIFTDICAVAVDDGMVFDEDTIQTSDIRDDQEYHGIRVKLSGKLDTAKIPVQIDIGFGDAVVPEPKIIEFPGLLDFPTAKLKAYSSLTVIAEKLNAMVVLGMRNSRIKDFYDVHVLLENTTFKKESLTRAIKATFKRRKTPIPKETPVFFTEEYYEDEQREIQWKAFMKRSQFNSEASFKDIIIDLRKRLSPIIELANSVSD